MSMVTVKIADLSGPALDWAVGRALGAEVKDHQFCATPGSHVHKNCTVFPSGHAYTHWRPSTDWGHGGPLVDKHIENICRCGKSWYAIPVDELGIGPIELGGTTPLIAAMRAIVAAHAEGDTVEVPAAPAEGDR